jgi:hypothetical protein
MGDGCMDKLVERLLATAALYTVNFDKGNKKHILLNKHQCARTWNFKFVINQLKLII